MTDDQERADDTGTAEAPKRARPSRREQAAVRKTQAVVREAACRGNQPRRGRFRRRG